MEGVREEEKNRGKKGRRIRKDARLRFGFLS